MSSRTPALTASERKLLRTVETRLKAAGTHDTTPAELVLDYVRLDTRLSMLNDLLARLTAEGDAKAILHCCRQVEGTLATRMRLATQLFRAPEIGIKTQRKLAAQQDHGAEEGGWDDLIQ